MKATFKVSYVLQRSKVKSNGKAPIVARIIVNGEKAHFSTHRWDAKGNRTLGSTMAEKTVNKILDEIRAALHSTTTTTRLPVRAYRP